MSEGEALADLQRGMRVGDLEGFLTTQGPSRFGGLYVDRDPYQVTILSSDSTLLPNQDLAAFSEVIVAEGFVDLLPFIEIRQVNYSSESLEETIEGVQDVAGRIPFAANGDIREGTIDVWADSKAEAQTLDMRIDEEESLPEPPRKVTVSVAELGDGAQADSYGGMSLSFQGIANYCTTGFSVTKIGGTAEGITTAAHCPDQMSDETGPALEPVVDAKLGGSRDIQWHRTPAYDDRPWFRIGPGITRDVQGVRDRVNQSVGTIVCTYGAATAVKTCGEILTKSYQIPNRAFGDGQIRSFNPTWIVVGDPCGVPNMDVVVSCTATNMSNPGDSGAPFFVAGNAYGTLHGEPMPYDNHYLHNHEALAVYMAQDYIRDLGIKVSVAS